ncbi:tyrosine-type recombinase/integrase [Pedobacter zeae]|uniref:Tyrosine recombinase XerC n=1 Tax=Pedobacter zeae TaxID=1737356 RepID=A0A7W6KA89_9SPHI|nr:tyrosine-type recombinase/integrase [Pedobacter zeae]MBB4107982.1 integrase/recombinase XerC [Pedobacter zeae]GGG95807.1 tyrosine recombinase XerC [Pedobacter zeae]
MLLESFITYLTHEKRYSQHTVTSYQTDLDQFEEFLKASGLDFSEVKHTHLRSYLVELMEEGHSENTVNRKISALRSFYKFLHRSGKIDQNPSALIKAPKIPKRLPVFVEAQKMDHLLDSAHYFDESFPSVRDHLVIELLFGTGMRLTELLQLKDSDIDVYSGTIKVLGKRNKERIIPVNKQLINQVNNYIELKKIQNFNNNLRILIVTNTGAAGYPKLIYRIVTSYLNYISTNEKKSPHVLRHSYATSLLNAGADLNAIKELLGHASLAATQVYTHNSIERLKTIYKQAHPKA